MRIVHVSAEARALRIRPGQTLADARAIAPNLVTFPDDPAADRRTLESLAVPADRFSPAVHIEGDDTLFLDVTGVAHLFGDEADMLRRALEELSAQGFAARGAIADTAGAAWALAHAHPEPAFVSSPGRLVEDIVSLPVWSLRIEDSVVESLRRVGVDAVASLLHLPRSSLAARFGDDVLARIDQSLGDAPEVLTPYRPPPVLRSEVPFGGATDRFDLVLEGVRRALELLCEKLAQQVAGANEVFITLTVCPEDTAAMRPKGAATACRQGIAAACQTSTAMVCGTGFQPVQTTPASVPTGRITLPLALSQPTRSAKHLLSLARVALERVRFPGPVETVSAWTREIEPLDDWQDELFNTDESDERELAGLVDRLAVRLGRDAVVAPRPVEDHQPERAYHYAACTKDRRRFSAPRKRERSNPPPRPQPSSNDHRHSTFDSSLSLRPSVPPSLSSLVRPLRLLPEPVLLAVTALYPEGPPVSFSLRGRLHVIAECIGPERIETGWWRGPHVRRDYYRITTKEGLRAWIYRDRDAGQWLLHGWFD